MINQFKVNFTITDNPFFKAGKYFGNLFGTAGENTQVVRMNSLLGDTQMENLENKIKDTINSIGDVSQLAGKLNVHQTMILRNYTTYKNIYD